MSVKRPTFSDNWHRVADLKPRLRPSVQTYRQEYRGQMWHVVSDPANNQFYRFSEPAWHFVALLDGRRTVTEAWKLSNEQLGDPAPTQGEVIRLLGQLSTSNLLYGDLPPDAEQMFDRYRKRVRREIGGYLMNFLFVRIPIFDPTPILKRWTAVFGWVFGPIGIALWAMLLSVAAYFLIGRWDDLFREGQTIMSRAFLLNVDNVISMYLCFACVKAIHEFGHGFACSHFGRKGGAGGAVHTMGIMLLVFMPVPYVDASSSWAFRNKWHRMFVGAGGMYVELAVAAVAAMIWSHTSDGTFVHNLAYNVMFIASVSTLIFNGNPLLRFDGYYILSDWLEIANLADRSKQYLYYHVRRYIYGVRHAISPAHTTGEACWMFFYAIAAFIYRVLICTRIIFFVADLLFILGAIMAVAAIFTWVLMPIGKWIKYLFTSPELTRTRGRALAASFVFLAALVTGLGAISLPEHGRAEGVVEPVHIAKVYTAADGFVDATLPSGTSVKPTSDALMRSHNTELKHERREVEARLKGAIIQRDLARREDPAVVQALTEQIAALRSRLDRIDTELASLDVHAPFPGTWISPKGDQMYGVFLPRGQEIGMVADMSELIIRVAADQDLGPRIRSEIGTGAEVELRVMGRPDLQFTGVITQAPEAGHTKLPSAALSYLAGGNMAVSGDDREGLTTTEPFFEVHIQPKTAADKAIQLLIGQRVVARFSLPERPLLLQWYRNVRQVIQRRFAI